AGSPAIQVGNEGSWSPDRTFVTILRQIRFPKLAIKSQSQSGNLEHLHKQSNTMAAMSMRFWKQPLLVTKQTFKSDVCFLIMARLFMFLSWESPLSSRLSCQQKKKGTTLLANFVCIFKYV
ncbi:hypothetical protein M5D96_001139, partial [Drosophila gunungcola]